MEALVQSMIDSGVLKTPAIINAFKAIDRANFIPLQYASEAYEDYPLPIGGGQTISQPSTVALMLELLLPQKDERVLDIGSGSGWTTALIAEIVGEKGIVCGLEIVPELVRFGKENLRRYGFKHARIEQAGKILGLPTEAPFDRILVSASARRFPRELVNQLKVGGTLVIPVQNEMWKVTRVSSTDIETEKIPGFVFVPLIEDRV